MDYCTVCIRFLCTLREVVERILLVLGFCSPTVRRSPKCTFLMRDEKQIEMATVTNKERAGSRDTHDHVIKRHSFRNTYEAATAGDVEALKEAVLTTPGDVNKPNSDGVCPLFLAVQSASIDCVRLLVSNNADPNVRPTINGATDGSAGFYAEDERDLSPFLMACKNGYVEIVEFLFHHGADVKLKNRVTGSSCLSLAIEHHREKTAAFLVTHIGRDDFLQLMRTSARDMSWESFGERTTPMRLLIKYMPDVAEIVLDRCFIPRDSNYRITCYLELLDDYFSPWAMHDEEQDVPVDTEVFDDEGVLKVEYRTQHHYRSQLYDTHPLLLMIESHSHLISHPACMKLIEHKWFAIGRRLHLTSFSLYCIFLALLTGYVLVNPASFYIKFHNSTTIEWYNGTEDAYYPGSVVDESVIYFFGIACPWILMAILVISASKEMVEMKAQGIAYFKYEKLLDWTIYFLTFCLVIPVTDMVYLEGIVIRAKWQWQFGAAAIFLAWMNLTLYLRQTASVGIYVIMFEVVLRSTFKFMAVLALFVIAFGLAFRTLLINQEDFHGVGDSLLKTFAMSTGELDVTRIFHRQNYLGTENTIEMGERNFVLTSVFSDAMTFIIFIVFVITMPIIAMNLLIGVAVEDIHRIRAKAKFFYLKLKVNFIVAAENICLDTFVRKLFQPAITVKFVTFRLVKNPSFFMRLFAISDLMEVQTDIRHICDKNQRRDIDNGLQAGMYNGQACSEDEVPQKTGLSSSVLDELLRMRASIDELIVRVKKDIPTPSP